MLFDGGEQLRLARVRKEALRVQAEAAEAAALEAEEAERRGLVDVERRVREGELRIEQYRSALYAGGHVSEEKRREFSQLEKAERAWFEELFLWRDEWHAHRRFTRRVADKALADLAAAAKRDDDLAHSLDGLSPEAVGLMPPVLLDPFRSPVELSVHEEMLAASRADLWPAPHDVYPVAPVPSSTPLTPPPAPLRLPAPDSRPVPEPPAWVHSLARAEELRSAPPAARRNRPYIVNGERVVEPGLSPSPVVEPRPGDQVDLPPDVRDTPPVRSSAHHAQRFGGLSYAAPSFRAQSYEVSSIYGPGRPKRRRR